MTQKMIKVRATAVMETDLEWEGYMPADIPEDERAEWISENVDGGDFVADNGIFSGGWRWGDDVDVLEGDEV